jgi:predicted amidohydrolase YtcJ
VGDGARRARQPAQGTGCAPLDRLDHGFLTVRAIKEAIDGALGSHGAWLLAPYEDLPSSSGLNTNQPGRHRESARLARELDLQLCVHAIGDRANRETLDLYERVLGPDAKTLDHRWRIEHAQHLDPADIGRFAKLGVIASMQGVHCTSDGAWVPLRLGQTRASRRRLRLAQAARQRRGGLQRHGLAVEDVDPLACLAATINAPPARRPDLLPRSSA